MEAQVAIERQNTKSSSFTTTLDLFIHILCFVSVLLIGADIWGVNVGVNLRLDQVFLLLLTACLIIRNGYRLHFNLPVTLFLLITLISVFFAFNVMRSITFYFSIVYNVFCIFYCFASYVETYGIKKFISIFRNTLYIQTALIIIQFILKITLGIDLGIFRSYGYFHGIPRFCLWFYEPSYLATFLIFWFAFSAYSLLINKQKGYLKDIILGAIAIFLTTSSTGYVGVALVIATVYLIWIARSISIKKILVLFLIIGLIVAFRFIFRSVFDVFIGRIFENGLESASGGRIQGWAEAYAVYQDHILFGVGPGNYGLYLVNDTSYLPSNVTLELLSTTGIFATIAFNMITFSYLIRTILINRKLHSNLSHTLVASVFALLMFTIILQVNQGYLRLYHWMFFGTIEGIIALAKKDIYNQTNL